MWEDIVKLKNVALVTTQTYTDELDSLMQAMDEEGLPLPVATKIIRGIWGEGSRANSLMVQLSECFPDTNRQVVLFAGLPVAEARKQLGQLKETRDYFEKIYSYIDAVVASSMKRLLDGSFTTENQELVNELRCEVLQYAAYTDGYFYEIAKQLRDGSLTSWAELNRVPDMVINGDYLFISDFTVTLEKAHAAYLDNAFYPDLKMAGYSLKDFSWRTSDMVSKIELPYLFASYLNAKYSAASAE